MSKRKATSVLCALLFVCSGFLACIAPSSASAVSNDNLALGKTVTASSSVESGGWGKAKLTDGIRNYPNYTSSIGYSSSGNSSSNHTEWVVIDLGANHTVGLVDLYPSDEQGSHFPIDFTIQTSTDNSNWTTRLTETSEPNPGGQLKRMSFDDGSVTARYVRIHATALQNIGGYYLKLSEVEIYSYGVPYPTNIAYHKTVTTSSSVENYGWSASNLTDGIRSPILDSPGWTSSSNTGTNHTEWAKVDLGYSFPLFEVVIDSAANNEGFPIDFTVQVSADDVNWTTVATRTAFPAPGMVSQDFRFPTIQARYVKITGTNLPTIPSFGYAMRLGEISVFTDQENVAVNRRVTASSTIEGGGGWSVANVVDGITVSDSSTAGWSSNNSTHTNHTEWVRIDLGQEYGVGQVDLHPVYSTGQGFPIDFTIQVSQGGSTWSTVVTRTSFPNPGGAKQSFTFTNTQARYVKVEGTNLWNTQGNYYMQLAEIGVYRNKTYTNASPYDYSMEAVTSSTMPVISNSHPGSSGNAFGYETGHVIKLGDGTYRMVATEMFSSASAWIPARVGLWTSSDGDNWTRLSTLVTGNNVTGDPHNYTWAPHFYYNTGEGRWNITYRGNATLFRLISTTSGIGGINGPYAESPNTLTPLLGNRKYWQNPAMFDGISNVYTVGSKLYAFVGDGASVWGPGLVTADDIAGPWTQEPTSDLQTFVYAENPITAQLSDGTYVAVFDEINTGARTLGFGYSFDGIHWFQKSTNIQVPWAATDGPVDSIRTPLSIIPQPDGTFTVYFTARNNGYAFFDIGKISVKMNKFAKTSSPATSSTFSSSWTAANLTDGNNSTVWSSVNQPTSAGAEWISLDKGQSTTMNGVTVNPRTASGTSYGFPVAFKFQTSADGVNWTNVPGQSYTSYPTPSASAVTFTFGSPVTARYVRMYATQLGTDNYGSYHFQAAGFSTT